MKNEITLYENETLHEVAGGYLVENDSFRRPVFSGHARLCDGSLEFLGKFESRREAEAAVEAGSKRAPLA